jgi:hypothetical protein
MEVSRMSNSGRRQGLKLPQDHPKELFGAWDPILGTPAAKQREGRAHQGRGRENHRTATEAGSLDKARMTGGAHHVRTVYGEGTARDLLRAV